MISWSETSAFWTFNQVTNWAYTRYNVIHPEIENYQFKLENQYRNEVSFIDNQALLLFKENQAKAVEYLTDYSVFTGNKLTSDWKEFYKYLFMKYMDGNLKATEGFRLKDNGNGKNIPARPTHPGYGKEWEKVMIQGTGDKLKLNTEK
jgi:hypothetical protein